MIIVLVGIDGAGKSTAGRLLAQQLNAADYPAAFRRNESGRRSLAAWCGRSGLHPPEAALDAVETVLRCANVLISHARARTGPGVVVMDRYLHCQLALRRARGLRVGRLLPFLLTVLPTPDVVFYFDVPVDVAHARITGRAVDTETIEHLQRFDDAYQGLDAFPSFIVLDASRSAEELVEDMLQELGMCGLGLQ